MTLNSASLVVGAWLHTEAVHSRPCASQCSIAVLVSASRLLYENGAVAAVGRKYESNYAHPCQELYYYASKL